MASSSGHRVPRRRGPVAVVLGGIAAGVLGTSLHAQVLYAGDTPLPLGAAAALLFSAAVSVFTGLWARSVLVSALTGVLTYVLLGLFTLDLLGGPLIVTGTASGVELPVVTAGIVWLYGQAVATVAAVLVCAAVLRREARYQRSHPESVPGVAYGTDPGYRPGPVSPE
ncbi:hypothetical protein LOC59_03725 [Arthrobacter sp. zg-Y916]|uniref:Uncharacterized protein n=1 Tax=Arthrobacter caoxuetaonis TaxID=2886935 RepID=A0A9X1MAX5_9MICC|nr:MULTISPECIES: hypothetical protein [Arthrobacter]MCC3296673.1 hypothetical protein [Arthrobacter caoxuetaonis]MCC9192763.1 hypothetical protein [Arthrobacter sp. zg-Y916]USQ56501.1 hypothetical protein NF551_12195 [Arthrobacter caoxuetaonis]